MKVVKVQCRSLIWSGNGQFFSKNFNNTGPIGVRSKVRKGLEVLDVMMPLRKGFGWLMKVWVGVWWVVEVWVGDGGLGG